MWEAGSKCCVWVSGVEVTPHPGSPALSVTRGAWAQPLSLLGLLHTTLSTRLRRAEQTAQSAPRGGRPGWSQVVAGPPTFSRKDLELQSSVAAVIRPDGMKTTGVPAPRLLLSQEQTLRPAPGVGEEPPDPGTPSLGPYPQSGVAGAALHHGGGAALALGQPSPPDFFWRCLC